jgi:hypothetical protein
LALRATPKKNLRALIARPCVADARSMHADATKLFAQMAARKPGKVPDSIKNERISPK